MNRNKILVCINSLRIGGAERLVVDLLRHWNHQSWELYLVTYSAEIEFAIDPGIITRHYVLGPCSNIRSVGMLYQICRENSIRLALCHLERPNKWMALGARLAGSSIITTVHNIGLYENKSLLKRFLLRSFFNNIPTRIISVSDGVTRYLQDFGIKKEKIQTIANGIDIQMLRQHWHVEPKDNTLCVLARLEPVKGLDLLLAALARLQNRTWKLKIIGDGSQQCFLETLATNLGISERVIFLGRQLEPCSHLQNVSLLCMPSYREGLPMALLECMSLGIPAVVSDVGYLPLVVQDGVNGYVFPSGSVDELSRRLARFFDTRKEDRQILSQNAWDLAEQYDIKKCVAQYIALTESISGTN